MSSTPVKQSCTSATSMSAGPTPAIVYACLRRLHRRRERRHVRLVLVHHPVEPEADPPYPHRPVGVAVDDLLTHEQQRGGAVALGRAVVEAERFDDDRRVQHVLDRDLEAQLRLRVADAVMVVLHRDHREVLARRRRLVEVAVHVQREVRRARPHRSGSPTPCRASGPSTPRTCRVPTTRAPCRRRRPARRRAGRWRRRTPRCGWRRCRWRTRSRRVSPARRAGRTSRRRCPTGSRRWW